jgi:hypothetical protein
MAGWASWSTFEREAPELAAFARERLDAHRHKMLATIRADGSPRIGGIEIAIDRGEVRVGGLLGSRKFDDVRRDPRVAIHSGSDDPPHFRGDVRLSGRLVELADPAEHVAYLEAAGGGPPGPFELFRLELTEVVTLREGGDPPDHLVIERWRPGEPIHRIERY